MAVLLFVGTLLWFRIDAAKEVQPEPALLVPAPALEGVSSC
jgi:hypothetical protein